MTKSIGKHARQKMGRCIFCGQRGNRTQTHIWPDWLKSVLTDETHRTHIEEEVTYLSNKKSVILRRTRVRQGGLFSQKPYFACETCNTGWMNDFEKEVIAFAKPVFTSSTAIILTRKQVRSLCGWISLIAILMEYNAVREKSSIPKIDRRYIREHLEPPEEWSIFAKSQNNPKLSPYHMTVRRWYDPGISAHELPSEIIQGRDLNTQLSIFGLGQIVVQLFTSSHFNIVNDFRTYANSQNFIQLWPMPSSLNLFARRFARFPTKIPLETDEIAELGGAYSRRFDNLFGVNSLDRFRG
jgi:hypothetical protein